MQELTQLLSTEGARIVLVLFLSFLIGLEREEHKTAVHYAFGGVRTFPLLGLIGYSLTVLSNGQLLPLGIGFLVVGGLLALSYRYKLSEQGQTGPSGATTEISALVTYLVGALVASGHLWIATTITVICMFLLELKEGLEGLTKRIPGDEILTFTKFLLLTAVILPILPNRPYGHFQINPFKTWLIVVAVSAISYGSYVILKLTKQTSGVLLTAILGGAYSSTVTTVDLAKWAMREDMPHLFSGAILVASAVMYLRLALLLALFNGGLFSMLAIPFLVLALGAAVVGWVFTRIADPATDGIKREFQPSNPLELRTAFLFGAIFVAITILTRLAIEHLGKGGVYSLAAIMGVSDVDPFILGLTQAAGAETGYRVAATAILVAAASNNFVKGIYAYSFAGRSTGVRSLLLLLGLGIAGLVPLLWIRP